MSAPETREYPLVWTDFGWANASLTEPRDRTLHWVKLPENHVYTFDGDGWFRIQPADRVMYESPELGHP